MDFEIVKGNIAKFTADAIVLPANTVLREGSGASSAIFEAAGRDKLTRACRQIGHCDVGHAVPTLAFNLNADYIIHAVVPRWQGGSHNEYGLLSSLYIEALAIADYMECESIAFPLLASGNNGFKTSIAFQIARNSINMFEGKHLKEATLIVYDEKVINLLVASGIKIQFSKEEQIVKSRRQYHRQRRADLLGNGINLAQKVMEDQAQKAMKYMEEPENREMMFKAGLKIAEFVLLKKI